MAQSAKTDSTDFKLNYCIFALVILCGLCFFTRLGFLPMLGPDEPRYAQIAREMYESGNWITTTLAGVHWFEKPALTYWLTALGYTFFGVSEFSARFFIAIFSSLGVFLLLFFGQRVATIRYGYLSATVLVTSGIWIGFSRAATFDLPLSVAMEIALLSFYLWFQTNKTSYWLWCCFGMGLAMLGKGLIGIVLPGAMIGLFLLLTGTLWTFLKRPKLILFGAVVFLLTIATWYVPVIAKHGHEFIQEFFIEHHFQRFLTNKFKHPQPFYFFTIVALLGCLPWTTFFFSNIIGSLKSWRDLLPPVKEKLHLFLWLWVLVIIGFFSISSSKLTGYILPAFPPIALLIGLQLEKWWMNKPRTVWRWQLLTILMILAGGAVWASTRAEKFLYNDPLMVLVLTATIIIAVLVICYFLFVRGEQAATLAFPFSIAIIIAVTTFTVMPSLGISQSTAHIIDIAQSQARAGERLVFFINNHKSVDFYAPSLPLREAHAELLTLMKPEEVVKLLGQQPTKSLLVMSPRRWVKGLTDIMPSEELWYHHTWVLIRLSAPDIPPLSQ